MLSISNYLYGGLQAIIEAMSAIDVSSLKNVNQGRDALAKVRCAGK